MSAPLPFVPPLADTTTVALGGAVAFAMLVLFSLVLIIKCYSKTSADKAFVRTGRGTAKVVVDGGALVLPVIHTKKWISLETMRLTVERKHKEALITNDKFRVDIATDFYVRVEANADDVLLAARSLGEYSMTPENIMTLIEAKLVGALRSVAATRQLIELHEKRDDFQDDVQQAVRVDLRSNGLTLESVAIVHLDQTDKDALDPNNVFDAEGLRRITDATERARQETNEIQRNAEVQIKLKDVHTRKEVLKLEQEREYAESEQKKDVDTFKIGKARETQEYRIEQEEAVKKREIEKEKSVQESEVAKNQRVEAITIEKQTFLIGRDREREQTEIEKELAIETSRRDKEVALIAKAEEVENSEAKKLAAVAERERAEQAVITVEKTAEAERLKDVAIIEQQAESERDRLEKQVAADAEAYEIQKRAQADAEAAELRAHAIERLAAAELKKAEAEAEGKKQLVEAMNVKSNELLIQEAVLALISQSPELMREAMKPAEKISDIRVINMMGGAGGGNGSGNGDGGGVAKGIVGSILEAGAALPLLKELLRMADVDADAEGGLPELVRKLAKKVPGVAEASNRLPDEVRRSKRPLPPPPPSSPA